MEKVDVSSITELKTATDAFVVQVNLIVLIIGYNYILIIKYFAKQGFKRSHLIGDVHLALGYIAVASAAGTAAYEYKIGFENAKITTLAGVVLYFLSVTALWAWEVFIEKGLVYQGSMPDKKVWDFVKHNLLT